MPSVSHVVSLVCVQGVAAGASLVPAWFVGVCAAWVPAAGLFLGALVWFLACRPAADRAQVRGLALRSGVCFGVLGGAAYATAWWVWPHAFELSGAAVAVVSPVLGVGFGVLVLALTLAAGDAAGTSRGSL